MRNFILILWCLQLSLTFAKNVNDDQLYVSLKELLVLGEISEEEYQEFLLQMEKSDLDCKLLDNYLEEGRCDEFIMDGHVGINYRRNMEHSKSKEFFANAYLKKNSHSIHLRHGVLNHDMRFRQYQYQDTTHQLQLGNFSWKEDLIGFESGLSSHSQNPLWNTTYYLNGLRYHWSSSKTNWGIGASHSKGGKEQEVQLMSSFLRRFLNLSWQSQILFAGQNKSYTPYYLNFAEGKEQSFFFGWNQTPRKWGVAWKFEKAHRFAKTFLRVKWQQHGFASNNLRFIAGEQGAKEEKGSILGAWSTRKGKWFVQEKFLLKGNLNKVDLLRNQLRFLSNGRKVAPDFRYVLERKEDELNHKVYAETNLKFHYRDYNYLLRPGVRYELNSEKWTSSFLYERSQLYKKQSLKVSHKHETPFWYVKLTNGYWSKSEKNRLSLHLSLFLTMKKTELIDPTVGTNVKWAF